MQRLQVLLIVMFLTILVHLIYFIQAENTYLLTLDGDIDFKAESVTLLVDRMKKNKKVGAACGRIHPIGTGTLNESELLNQ